MPEAHEPIEEHHARELTDDEKHLAKLGYRQDLNRSWSGFSNFAISFSIISILAGCFTNFGAGFNNGGPISISWSWPILGLFILLIGWFGFNPGSELAADAAVPGIFVTTLLGGVTGCIVAMAVVWAKTGKPDVAMAGNGLLAGLVGITAGCGSVNNWSAVIIGAVAGVLVVFAVFAIDRLKIDDPVGAVSVHGVCGIWGVIAVGLFAREDVEGPVGPCERGRRGRRDAEQRAGREPFRRRRRRTPARGLRGPVGGDAAARPLPPQDGGERRSEQQAGGCGSAHGRVSDGWSRRRACGGRA